MVSVEAKNAVRLILADSGRVSSETLGGYLALWTLNRTTDLTRTVWNWDQRWVQRRGEMVAVAEPILTKTKYNNHLFKLMGEVGKECHPKIKDPNEPSFSKWIQCNRSCDQDQLFEYLNEHLPELQANLGQHARNDKTFTEGSQLEPLFTLFPGYWVIALHCSPRFTWFNQ